MKTFAPHYYKKFHCIADKCKHSCCIGWEIDIDEKSLDFYRTCDGKLKERFERNISLEDTPHFVLDKDERCPFLNYKNLCDIYKELGEDCLCRICTDHPRFKNFYNDRIEMGLGLCCEEACRIIFENDEVFSLEVIADDMEILEISEREKSFLDLRDSLFEIITDKKLPFCARFDKIFELLCIKFEYPDYNEIFDGLEYMDEAVREKIVYKTVNKIPDIYLEKLAVYFLYRHLADSLFDGRLNERVVFSYISAKAIENMCKNEEKNEIEECARIYSSEIEYSEENVEEILCRIGEKIEVSI